MYQVGVLFLVADLSISVDTPVHRAWLVAAAAFFLRVSRRLALWAIPDFTW